MTAPPGIASPALDSVLGGRRVIVGVCGGIAAYKVADIVSKLAQMGAIVDVCMTPESQRFVTPLTFQALSGRPVRTDTFELVESSDPQHISLTERAELMLIAPAGANIIGKIANGICDELVSLMVSAAACPVIFAPAMNNRMWENPIVRENVTKLQRLGYRMLGPDAGWLACRNIGPGRMSDPAKIVEEILGMLTDPLKMPHRMTTPA